MFERTLHAMFVTFYLYYLYMLVNGASWIVRSIVLSLYLFADRSGLCNGFLMAVPSSDSICVRYIHLSTDSFESATSSPAMG